jgi:hypothetical protein
MARGVGRLRTVGNKDPHARVCHRRGGGREWTCRSGGCGGSRSRLEVGSDHGSNISRKGQCSQKSHSEAYASPQGRPAMRVERTHRAELRWHDLAKLVSGDGEKGSEPARGWIVLDQPDRRTVSRGSGPCRISDRVSLGFGGWPICSRWDPPNPTTLVDDLVRSGLVERQGHPTDRSVNLVVATPDPPALGRRAEEVCRERSPADLLDLPGGDSTSWCGSWLGSAESP